MFLNQRQRGAIALAGGGLLMGTLGMFVEEARLGVFEASGGQDFAR